MHNRNHGLEEKKTRPPSHTISTKAGRFEVKMRTQSAHKRARGRKKEIEEETSGSH